MHLNLNMLNVDAVYAVGSAIASVSVTAFTTVSAFVSPNNFSSLTFGKMQQNH